MKTPILVAAYLVAIVPANLSVARGASVAIVNAFLFIALDLTSRDALHSAWRGRSLAWRMAALIATGSAAEAMRSIAARGRSRWRPSWRRCRRRLIPSCTTSCGAAYLQASTAERGERGGG